MQLLNIDVKKAQMNYNIDLSRTRIGISLEICPVLLSGQDVSLRVRCLDGLGLKAMLFQTS